MIRAIYRRLLARTRPGEECVLDPSLRTADIIAILWRIASHLARGAWLRPRLGSAKGPFFGLGLALCGGAQAQR